MLECFNIVGESMNCEQGFDLQTGSSSLQKVSLTNPLTFRPFGALYPLKCPISDKV